MEKVEIQTPCTESWDEMAGGQAIRHCAKCQFNVYNFEAMTEDEIRKVLHNGERICARLFVRPDGTYMTKNCKDTRKRNRILKWIGLAALMPVSLLLFKSDSYSRSVDKLRDIPVIGTIINKLNPKPTMLMGEAVCVPQPKTQVKIQQPENTAK